LVYYDLYSNYEYIDPSPPSKKTSANKKSPKNFSGLKELYRSCCLAKCSHSHQGVLPNVQTSVAGGLIWGPNTPLKINGWNMSSWRFGSDHFPFL